MKKLIFVSVFVLGLALVASASAATISNIRFDNNQTTKTVNPGESVNVTFRVTVPAGEVVELGQVDVLGDNLAPELASSLGGELGLQEGQHDVQATITAPQNTGYYAVQFRTAGIFGGQRAVVITDGIQSNTSFANAIRVVDPNANTGSSGSGSSAPSWFSSFQSLLDSLMKQVAELTKAVANPPAGGTTPLSEKCTQLMNASAGTYFGASNATSLQLYLISNGFSIPAGATGYWGSQTQNAYNAFKLANSCK